MIQALRQRLSRLAGYLAVLWFVLFVACSLVHVGSHAHADEHPAEASASVLGLLGAAELLQLTGCHDSAGSGMDESCSALQNTPLSQLLLLLALAALPGLLALPDQLNSRLLRLVPATAPGYPPPLHLQLQRFNE